MGKKHAHEEHENHERWVISFADMMTLLFALFVVLYALKEESVREAQRSIAFFLNLEGFSQTRRDGIFETGEKGGETQSSVLIFSTERGPMKMFAEESAQRFESAGGRSLEIRELDEGVAYEMPLVELYEETAEDIREEFREWLRTTVEGAMPYSSLLRVRIEATAGDVYIPGVGTMTHEQLCMRRLVKLLRWIEIDTGLREDQIQVEFRHYRAGQALIRSREDWQEGADLTLLFVATE
jgi:hypothetical protein